MAEKAVVADALEAVGQHMEQETANEFVGLQGHDFLPVVITVILPEEGDRAVLHVEQAVVGNGHAVGIAAQVVEDLLGLKGTMSEFELGLLRQRAREAFEQEVKRGFALWELPVGFIRTEQGRIEKAPDRQVQQALQTVFQKFRQLGSARQATIWFREEQIPVPQVKPGTAGQEMVWALPSSGRIRQMLRNPCYAGVFAYGKTTARTVIEEGRARQGSRYQKPPCEWKVLIRDHHEGYICWEEYVQNQQRLEANVAWAKSEGSGAAKAGAALLSGLLRCGRCGRKLQVRYSGRGGRVPGYVCRGDRGDRGSSQCMTVGSLRLDQAVVNSVLEAIQPVGIEAALRVSERAQVDDEEKREALELALERGRYEADRARRQFDAVEPENRLVASELETRWNRALTEVAEREARLAALGRQAEPFTEQQKAELMALSEDLPALWHHPEAPVQLKKRILRTVLSEIIIQSDGDLAEHQLRLHWVGFTRSCEFLVTRREGGSRRHRLDRRADQGMCRRVDRRDSEPSGIQDGARQDLERVARCGGARVSRPRSVSPAGRLDHAGASGERTAREQHGGEATHP